MAQCTFATPGGGPFFSLRSLGTLRVLRPEFPVWMYVVDPCVELLPHDASDSCGTQPSHAFQVTGETGDVCFRLASGNATVVSLTGERGGVQLRFGGGDACPSGTPRSLQLDILCAPFTSVLPSASEMSPCAYRIELHSPAGCVADTVQAPPWAGAGVGAKPPHGNDTAATASWTAAALLIFLLLTARRRWRRRLARGLLSAAALAAAVAAFALPPARLSERRPAAPRGSPPAPPLLQLLPARAFGEAPGRWSALPVNASSVWVARAPARGAPPPAPLLISNRRSFIAHFAGRTVAWMGDSVTREQYYHFLLWLYGCDVFAGGYDADPLPPPANRTLDCAALEPQIFFMNGGFGRTWWVRATPYRQVLNTGDSFAPIELLFWWCAYVADFSVAGQKTPAPWGMANPSSPSLAQVVQRGAAAVLINVGLWHIRHAREATKHAPLDGAVEEARVLVRALPAAARGVIVWRSATWTAGARQDMDLGAVLRIGDALAGVWRAAGYRVLNASRFFAAQYDLADDHFTTDGMHLRKHLSVHLAMEALSLARVEPPAQYN